MKFTIAEPQWIHHIGQRANQEDSLFPFEAEVSANDRLFILCDGMGGHESGEVASQTVCECMGRWFSENYDASQPLTTEQFNKALYAAYDGLDAKDNPDAVKKMGTTMTFVALHAGGATIAHIGDSRIYQIRPATGEILYKSRDHSLVNDLVRLGEMTEEEARVSPSKNVITRAMQPHQVRRSKADIDCVTNVKAGDYFYMCSDGMLEQMEDQELVSILADASTTDAQKKQILLDKTVENKDNHTAFLIHVLEVEGEAVASADASEEVPVVMMLDADNEEGFEPDPVSTQLAPAAPVQASRPASTPSATPSAKRPVRPAAPAPKKSSTSWLRVVIFSIIFLLLVGVCVYYLTPWFHQPQTTEPEEQVIDSVMQTQPENKPEPRKREASPASKPEKPQQSETSEPKPEESQQPETSETKPEKPVQEPSGLIVDPAEAQEPAKVELHAAPKPQPEQNSASEVVGEAQTESSTVSGH